MSFGSSSPQTSTTTSKIEIPPWLEDQLKVVGGDAGALYKGGYGPQYYPGQTYLPFNAYQTEAQDTIAQLAADNELSPRAYDTYAGVMDRGGVAPGTYANTAGAESVARGDTQITTAPQYQGLLGSISGGNPQFQQALADQSARIADQANAQFTTAGRYGSGAHAGVLADRIGELQTKAMAEQYNRDIANQLAGLQGLSNVQATNIQGMTNAGLELGKLHQSAQKAALDAATITPQLAKSRYDDPMQLLGLGGMLEAKDAEILKDAIMRFEFEQAQPWSNVGRLAQALQGVNAGQTTTQVSQLPQTSGLQSILGGGMMGASIGGMAGLGLGPLGVLGGGLLGGLAGGLFK
jgi:hypothetical protein